MSTAINSLLHTPDVGTPPCGPSDASNAASSETKGKNKGDEVMFKTQQCRTYATKGHCPYEYMCMYAHGPGEVRTKEMNVRDCLTTAEQVRPYQMQLKASGYSTKWPQGMPASPLPGMGGLLPLTASGSFPGSPSGIQAVPQSLPGSSALAGLSAALSWMQQTPGLSKATLPSVPNAATLSPLVHSPRCDCRECRMATAQAAQAQALACPCPECIAAAHAALAAVAAVKPVAAPCRLAVARAAQAQVQVCPCLECMTVAQTALAAAAQPCPCPDCATRGCNDGSSMGAPTSGMSAASATPASISRLNSRDYMQMH